MQVYRHKSDDIEWQMRLVQTPISFFGAGLLLTRIVLGLLYIEGCSGNWRCAGRMPFLHRCLGSCERSGGVCIPIEACKEPRPGQLQFSPPTTADAVAASAAVQSGPGKS